MNEKKAKKSRAAKPQDMEFTGYVESITASSQFQFEITSKKIGRRSYSVAAGDAAVAALVTASYLAGKKISVTGAPNGGSIPVAREVRLGAKAKSRKIKAYPRKLTIPAEHPAPQTPPQA
jgi:hypothetical protein